MLAIVPSQLAFGQGGQGGAGSGQGATPAIPNAQTGGTVGGLGLTPETAFQGGVDRSGAVGTNTGSQVGTNQTSAGAGGGFTGGGLGGGGGFAGGLGAAFGNLFGGGNANAGNASTPAIRTRLRSGITVAPLPSPQMTMAAQRNLVGAGAFRGGINPAYAGVRVNIRDRSATLSGEVASEADRRMSQLLMRLEPGVHRVENQIRVAPQTSAPMGNAPATLRPR